MARSTSGWALVGMALVAALAAGCSETLPLTRLPDIARLPGKVLSQEEQQKTMNQMSEKGQTQPVEAAKEIEKSK